MILLRALVIKSQRREFTINDEQSGAPINMSGMFMDVVITDGNSSEKTSIFVKSTDPQYSSLVEFDLFTQNKLYFVNVDIDLAKSRSNGKAKFKVVK